jgi:hypothetical protein
MTRHSPIDSDLDDIVIAYEHGDVLIFDSIDGAERYVEPIDVENDEYIFYNGRAQLLTAVVVKNPKGYKRVKIQTPSTGPSSEPELRKILTRLLSFEGYDEDNLLDKTLNTLIRESLKFRRE